MQGHTEPVLCTTFLPDSNRMLSLDASGKLNLWNYNPEAFTGFGWFTPSSSYNLDSAESTFVARPMSGVDSQQLYPVRVAAIDSEPSLSFQQKLQMRRDAERQYQSFLDTLSMYHE